MDIHCSDIKCSCCCVEQVFHLFAYNSLVSHLLHIDTAYCVPYRETTGDPVIAYFLPLLVMGFTMSNYRTSLFHAGVKFLEIPANIDLV
jgi:hypothetical protein